MINPNTATLAQIESLPGVTAQAAAAVIAGRPWANAAALLAKVKVPPSAAAQLTFEGGSVPPSTPAPVAQKPASPPISTPPAATTNPVITTGFTPRVIQPSEDFTKIVGQVKGQPYVLAPGVHCPPAVQLESKVTGWTLDATGASINWTLPPGGPHSCFKFSGGSGQLAKIIGGAWKTNAILAACYGTATLQGLTLLDGATQGVIIDEQFGNAGTGTVVQDCIFGLTNSVSVYSTQPFSLIGGSIRGSVGEVGLRVDSTNPGDVAPDLVIIDGVDLGGANLKGAAEFRMLGTNCVVRNVKARDYIRVGQDHAKTPGESCADLTLDNITFIGQGPLPQNLMLKNGIIKIGRMAYSVANHPVTFGGPAQITFNPALTPGGNVYNPANVAGNVQIIGGY